MCGASLGRKIPEGTALKMRVPFPERCPVCGSDAMPSGGECPDCGYPVYNRCRAEYNRPSHINPPDARFCETCGASTLYAFLAETPGIERGSRFMIYSVPPVNSMFSLTIHHILRCRSNIRQRFQIS